MAVSFSGIAPIGSDFNTAAPTPRPAAKPTEEEQVHQLLLSGLSNQQIATTTGLPLSEVLSTLGDTSATSSQTSASSLATAAGRLSVTA